MNNFMISVKRFFTNKNTVTIIGVVIVLGILYYGYSSTIKKAVNPVRVPIAKTDLQPQTQITSDDIQWIEVPAIEKPDNVLTNSGAIVGKYVGVNSMIPKGSMFYSSALINKEDLPGSWLKLLTTDEIPLYFNVDLISTFNNSIQPEDYVDFYMKAEGESGLVMYGKLMENVQIKAVVDGSGEDVFKSSTAIGTPSILYYGLENDLYMTMKKATFLNRNGVELAVVPHGGAVPLTGDVEVSSKYLRDYIFANTLDIPDEDKVDEDKTKNKDKNKTGNNNNSNNSGNTIIYDDGDIKINFEG